MINNSVQMKCKCERQLAAACIKEFEKRRLTISEALGRGMAMLLEDMGEHELAAMMQDGRGIIPRPPLRHSKSNRPKSDKIRQNSTKGGGSSAKSDE